MIGLHETMPDLDDPEFSEKWISNLIEENKRLKKFVNDLQREYMNRISELAEIHPMEDK